MSTAGAFYPNGSPVFVPGQSAGTSIGVGLGALGAATGQGNTAAGQFAGSTITTGTNNTIVGQNVASTTLTTGSNNIIIGTSSAADAATASTSNTFWLGGGATAIMSATAINSTPVVTIPGTLTTGGISGVGTQVGGAATAFTNTGSTLATVTGMSITLPTGTYVIDGYLSCQCAATPGLNLKFLQGAVGASTVLMDTWVYSTTTLTAQANIAALSSSLVSAAVAATAVFFGGTIIVSTAGTLTLQAAQSVSNATLLTIASGSYITANRIA